MSQSQMASNDLLESQLLTISKCKKSGAWFWNPYMNQRSKIARTGSGCKGHATLHSSKSGTGQVPSGSSNSISKASWIVHLDASFKYSRHTRGRPARGVSHVQFPCSTTCGVGVHLARDAYLYHYINSISIHISECQWL